MGNQEMIQKGLADLGERLRIIRVELRVQQKEMAAVLEMEPGYLSDIESGKVNPGADFFLKLAEKYNINLNYLLLGIGDLFLETDQTLSEEGIDLESDIDSIDKLVLLMNMSPYFKARIFGSASMVLFENSEIIRRGIKKYKSKKETNNEQTN